MTQKSNVTILIVDDDDDFRQALAFDFKRRGFQVTQANCGQEALKSFLDTPVEVVLSDVRMPNGDGKFLLAELKKATPKFPIFIFISGFSELNFKDVQQGVEAVFPKPFDRVALMSTIDRALSSNQTIDRRPPTPLLVSTPSPVARGPHRLVSTVFICVRGKEQTCQFPILDIAKEGMFISCDGPFPQIGDNLKFTIRPNGENSKESDFAGEVEGGGVVSWVRNASGPTQPPGIGVRFRDLPEKSVKRLANLLNFLEAE